MFPLAIPEIAQRIIVSATISLAALAIVRILFKSRKAKSGSCSKCHLDQ